MQLVQYTARGRAYNKNSPLLGDTANVAFLAATYAKTAASKYSKQASRYWCWARTQTRYMLGDGGRRYITLLVTIGARLGHVRLQRMQNLLLYKDLMWTF